MKYRPELHSLRGIACLLVIITHAFSHVYPGFSIGHGVLVAGTGKIGVWLFFALSAFLITHNFLATGLHQSALITYVAKRSTRILIPFFAAVVIYRIVGTLGIDSWRTAAEILTFQSTAGHLWTIPTEFTFYFALPVILFVSLRVRERCGGSAELALYGAVAGLCLYLWEPARGPINSMWFGWYITTFLAGMVAAILSFEQRALSQWAAKLLGAGAALAIVLFTVAAKLDFFGNPTYYLVDKHYVYGPLWAVVIYSVYVAPPRFLRNTWLEAMGRWSYSAYLFHWAFCVWGAEYLDGPVAFMSILVASVAVGWVGYWTLEVPSGLVCKALLRERTVVRPAAVASS